MKSRSFFILTLIFTATCFFWWADQLYHQENELYIRKIKALDLEKALAEKELQIVKIQDPTNLDSIKETIESKHANLLVQNYQGALTIKISPNSLITITESRDKALNRLYILGGVFLILLTISFVWIYRSLSLALRLNHQQNNFLLAVTHELKTPVAGMKLMWDSLQRPLKKEQQELLIEQGQKESIRMSELIENILMATRMNTESLKFRKQAVNLCPLLQGYINRVEQFNAKRQSFEIIAPQEAWVNGDELSLKLVIYNLLENAIKYSPQAALISCTIQSNKGHWELHVKDQGSGIPDAEKKKVFQKFYRLGDESTRNAKGTGLGLYLVNEIIQKHDGKVWVANNIPTGSIFHLIIPKL